LRASVLTFFALSHEETRTRLRRIGKERKRAFVLARQENGMLVVGAVSQKGGVGKSAIARLIAREYAASGWAVRVADFDVKQMRDI
jgi:Mrp family chromosome partitioning ATPase